MRLAFPLLLSSLLFASTHAHALADGVYTPEPTQCEIPDHTPESCSLDDAKACDIDKKNVDVVKRIMNLFSKKIGNCVVFTTANFEEIIGKMRELKITDAELEIFKKDPSICIDKLRPVVELAALHAGVQMDDEMLKLFCEEASFAFYAYSVMQKYVALNSWVKTGVNTVILGVITAAGYKAGGLGSAGFVAGVGLLIYTFAFGEDVPAVAVGTST